MAVHAMPDSLSLSWYSSSVSSSSSSGAASIAAAAFAFLLPHPFGASSGCCLKHLAFVCLCVHWVHWSGSLPLLLFCCSVTDLLCSRSAVERNNVYTNSTLKPVVVGTLTSMPYYYTIDAASTVASIVVANAGTGKVTGL